MKTLRLAIAACLLPLSLSLTACGALPPGESTPTAPNVDAATSEGSEQDVTEKDSAKTSQRGNPLLQVGEPAGLTVGKDNKKFVDFSVKKITPEFICTDEYAQPPEHGHFVAVDIEAQTGNSKAFNEAFYGAKGPNYTFDSNLWKFVNAKGTTANSASSGSAYSCIPHDQQMPEMGPSERATGTIILDLPTTQGTLIFDDMISGKSWEWEIPAK